MTIKIKNPPSLRFKEFDREWQCKKIGELCDFIVPGRNKPTNFGGNIPWITTPDIEHNGIITTSKNGLVISKEEAKSVGSKIVPVNSIIISCVGDLGLVAITGKEIVINQQLHAFIPREFIKYTFLQYALSNKKKYMDKVATKTAVPYMNKENCNSIPITYPTIPEQQKIASFLSVIDKKIQQLTHKKELLEQYKKGVMQQLFSGNLRFKDENGKVYPKWEEKKLGEISEIIMGQSPRSNSYNNDTVGMPLIQGNADIKERVTSPRQWTSEPTKNCEIGDLILTVRAPVGSIAKSIHTACIGRGVCSIRTNKYSHNEYLYQFLLDYEDKWKRIEQGSTFTAVSGSDINSIKLNLPSLQEQKKIANFLSSMDVKIESVNAQIEETKKFKNGLLQQMFV